MPFAFIQELCLQVEQAQKVVDNFGLTLNDGLIRLCDLFDLFIKFLVEISLQFYATFHKLMDLFIIESRDLIVVFLMGSGIFRHTI
jgi:hypothetical protein